MHSKEEVAEQPPNKCVLTQQEWFWQPELLLMLCTLMMGLHKHACPGRDIACCHSQKS